MNTLRIINKLRSRGFLRELFLLATLTLMVIFTNILMEPLETYLDTKRELERDLPVDFDAALRFSPTAWYLWEMPEAEPEMTTFLPSNPKMPLISIFVFSFS